MAEQPHRLFVAVPLPADAVAACGALIDQVRNGPSGAVARWVHVPTLHLTLRFLGDTAPDLVPDVALAVREALISAGQGPFQVRLAGAGAFPGARKPRTLWLGIEHGAAELGALARSLDPVLEPLGWPPDARPYRPHLTVARLDAAPSADGVQAGRALERAAAGWRTSFLVGRAVLYRSRLGGGPPRHDPIDEVRLPTPR